MNQLIIDISEKFVLELLEKELTKEHLFHNIQHTIDVKNAVVEIGALEGISDEEQEILIIAALFHDVGYTKVYDGHEEESNHIARSFLEKENYDKDKLQEVLNCITATKFDYQPTTKLQQIISDADLSSLGKSHYMERQASLRKEWAFFRNEKYSDENWRALNLDFFQTHQFFTPAAKKLYDAKKQSNFALIKSA